MNWYFVAEANESIWWPKWSWKFRKRIFFYSYLLVYILLSIVYILSIHPSIHSISNQYYVKKKLYFKRHRCFLCTNEKWLKGWMKRMGWHLFHLYIIIIIVIFVRLLFAMFIYWNEKPILIYIYIFLLFLVWFYFYR